MPYFQSTFNSGTTGEKVSVIFSLYTVGSIVGAPFAAVIADRLGRRKGMFIGGWVIILGMIIISTAHVLAQFVIGRFVLGFGIAIMTVSAPAYSIEIAPPHWRGRFTGFYNCGWFGGSVSIPDPEGPLSSFACLISSDPRCSHRLRMQLHRLPVLVPYSPDSASIRLSRRNLRRLHHPRVAALADGPREGRGSC
jgi:MFS family permease